MLLVLMVLLLAALATIAVVGARNRLPSPPVQRPTARSPTRARATSTFATRSTGVARLLVGGDGSRNSPSYLAPDGRWLSYVTSTSTGDAFMIALADGSEPARAIAQIPRSGNAQAAWAPDSPVAVTLVYDVDRTADAVDRPGERLDRHPP